MSAVRRFIDRHLVAIGVWSLIVGMLLTIIESLAKSIPIPAIDTAATSGGVEISVSWVVVTVLSHLAAPLVYNSVLLIAIGVLLRNWRVTVVGFENSKTGEIVIEGPDEANIVWVGKAYPSRHDAQLVTDALAKRLTHIAPKELSEGEQK
jgi:hypothetical protein